MKFTHAGEIEAQLEPDSRLQRISQVVTSLGKRIGLAALAVAF